ncbi:MAG TPA: 1-phosphofructokinase family hexose kinase [Verrucomicrobiae bacterium]|nr:1-phosphofructokinase family hexose kinase [Verrucomicrobiae bacterium]
MIVTVTVNPTIDRVITVDRLAFEDRAYINSTHESPGGRGINASRVIHCFGGKTLALLTSGGDSGKRLEAHLANLGFPFQTVPIENQTRTNLVITDRHGLTVNLNEAGPVLSKVEVARAEKSIKDALAGATWLMVCGSVPPGVPADFYARLISAARKKKVKTLLHADSDSLRHGLEEKPTVVTPNQQEAERLLGRTLVTRTHYLDAAPLIRAMGAESVVLSVGSRGAVGAFDVGVVEAVPPRVDAVSPIGAGDALSAAYTWAIQRKSTPVEAMRWGVAAGTASACLPGMSFADLKQTEAIFSQVELRRAE